MDPLCAIVAGTTGGVLLSFTTIAVLIKKRQNKKKMKKMPKFNEEYMPQRQRELHKSFQHRDCFTIEHIDDDLIIDQDIKLKPIKEQDVIDKHENDDSFKEINRNSDMKDFTCPLSGELMTDPVTLNGYVYDKDTLEDWIYRSDWLDPFYIFDNQDNSTILTESMKKRN